MKPRFSTIVAAVVMAVVVACAAWAFGFFEPNYNGVPASTYLRNLVDQYRFGGVEDGQKVRAVPAHVGVPILVFSVVAHALFHVGKSSLAATGKSVIPAEAEQTAETDVGRFTPVAIALACRRAPDTFLQMKLQQGQVWQRGDEYIQIVQVERLSVQYKARKRLNRKEGTHHTVTKKEFCRLLKTAELLPQAESDA